MKKILAQALGVLLLLVVGRLLLCTNEFGIVNVTVVARVVHFQNRIDQRRQLLVSENLILDLILSLLLASLLYKHKTETLGLKR